MSSFVCRDRTHTESEPEVVPGSLAVKGELVEVLVGIQRAVPHLAPRFRIDLRKIRLESRFRAKDPKNIQGQISLLLETPQPQSWHVAHTCVVFCIFLCCTLKISVVLPIIFCSLKIDSEKLKKYENIFISETLFFCVFKLMI